MIGLLSLLGVILIVSSENVPHSLQQSEDTEQLSSEHLRNLLDMEEDSTEQNSIEVNSTFFSRRQSRRLQFEGMFDLAKGNSDHNYDYFLDSFLDSDCKFDQKHNELCREIVVLMLVVT